MACWKSLALAVAILGSISVTSAQLTASFVCQPGAVATDLGSFLVTVTSGGVTPLVLSNYKQVLPATFVGCLDGALTRDGVTNDYTFTVTVARDQTAATGTILPCGVEAVGTDGYTLNFATASLQAEGGVTGYIPSSDKRFVAACDSFTAISVPITATGFAAVGLIANEDATNTLPPGFSIVITTATAADPTTFTAVDPATAIALDSKLQVTVVLDTTASVPVSKFRVTNMQFGQTGTLTGAAETTTRTVILAKLNADVPANVCPTAAGSSLTMPVTAGVFTAGTGTTAAGTPTVTATSASFDVLSLFQPNELDGTTLPPLILTATIVACGAADSCDPAETCSAIAARKRRDAGEELERGENVDKGELYTTVLVSVDPRAIAYAQATQALSGSNTVCEPMTSNMGYLIGMIVLAALLVFSVAVTVFMFSRMNRPRAEYPKA